MSSTTKLHTTRILTRLLAVSTLMLTTMVLAASRAAAMVPQPDPVAPARGGTVAPAAAGSSTGAVLWAVGALLALALAAAVVVRLRQGRRQHRRPAEARPDQLPSPIG